MALPRALDFDWRRLMRWSIFGAIVMALWLLAPAAKCSYRAFANEPLDEAHPISDTAGSHKQDVVEGDGFFSRWGSAIKMCYRRTPPLEQAAWKRNVMYGLLGASVLFYVFSEIERRNKRTYS